MVSLRNNSLNTQNSVNGDYPHSGRMAKSVYVQVIEMLSIPEVGSTFLLPEMHFEYICLHSQWSCFIPDGFDGVIVVDANLPGPFK